ncbi:IclR family transcriptional regulator [Niallia oryzisoli]|uniref:IclR family transcriptional regulator n=1 Tax=Niallia oryzisoli TaxID=1737571 RepID=A0ABZ2C8S0_9BACI
MSSVHNAIKILQTFSKTETELGISDLSVRLGLAKSTVFRLMQTLKESNLVEKNQETQKYQLGIAAFELGFTVYHSMELRRISVPILERLSNSINRVVRLGVYDNGGVVYLVNRSPNGDNATISKIGDRIPTHCTAVGKMLLAYQNNNEVERVIELGLRLYTNKTIVSGKELKEQLNGIRQKGYALTMEEWRNGVSSVAVPVKNDLGKVVGAVSITGPRSSFSLNQIEQYVRELRQCSRLITEQMGMDYFD